jgi:hypothetical protein
VDEALVAAGVAQAGIESVHCHRRLKWPSYGCRLSSKAKPIMVAVVALLALELAPLPR